MTTKSPARAGLSCGARDSEAHAASDPMLTISTHICEVKLATGVHPACRGTVVALVTKLPRLPEGAWHHQLRVNTWEKNAGIYFRPCFGEKFGVPLCDCQDGMVTTHGSPSHFTSPWDSRALIASSMRAATDCGMRCNPRSHFETVRPCTPSLAASCAWVRPRAVRVVVSVALSIGTE